jgi:hypothetical protein
MVPAFAVHWAVVVGQTSYHAFRNRDDAALDSADPFRNGASLKFYVEFNDICPVNGIAVVGKTEYSHEQRCEIGVELIKAFGDYHRLFWNCQTFANCYLRIITGGREFHRSAAPSADKIPTLPHLQPHLQPDGNVRADVRVNVRDEAVDNIPHLTYPNSPELAEHSGIDEGSYLRLVEFTLQPKDRGMIKWSPIAAHAVCGDLRQNHMCGAAFQTHNKV